MAKIQQQLLLTLDDVLQALAPYAGGEVPDTGDEEYGWWVNWVQRGQADMARRAFWRTLLTPLEEIELVAAEGETTTDKYYLPRDFYRHNGIYQLMLNDTDISKKGNDLGVEIGVFQERVIDANDKSEVRWYILFNQQFESGTKLQLSYYANPAIPEEGDDELALDGEAIMFYALSEYYRQTGEQGSQDDAKQDYENRFNELISLENLPQNHETHNFAMPTQSKVGNRMNAKSLFKGIDRS